MKLKSAILMTLVAVTVPSFVAAQPAAQDANPQNALAQCLVAHTSDADRALLIKWIFTQFALAPDVAPLSRVTPQQRDQTNQKMGQLITRLLADNCANETRLAYGAEGSAAIQGAFQVLGSTAARGLMKDPNVEQGMDGFAKFLDQKKLAHALGVASSSG